MSTLKCTNSETRPVGKMWIPVSIICSSILFPTLRVAGFPGFRLEQIIVILMITLLFLRSALGNRNATANRNFVAAYTGFSIFIILSISVGSFLGVNVIANDFFELYKIFIYLGAFILTSDAARTDEKRLIILRFVHFFLLLSCLVAFQQYFNLFGLNEKYVHIIAPTQYRTLVNNYANPRVVGMTSNPNEYAIMPGVGALISLCLYILTKQKKYIFSIGMFFFTLLLTMSRTGLVFMILAISALSFFRFVEIGQKNKRVDLLKFVIILVSIVLLGIMLLNWLPDSYTWRIKDGLNLTANTSFQARIRNWQEHIEYYKKSPIFGLGPSKSVAFSHSADNEWLLLLRQYGIVGVIYFVFVFSAPFIRSKRSVYKKLYFSLILAAAIYMIPAGIYHSFQLMPLFMVLAGLVPFNSQSQLQAENCINSGG